MVIKEIKKDKKIDTKLRIEKSRFGELIISLIPKTLTAPKVGMDSRKDIFAESNLLKFNNLAAVIVIPDLLTPGIKESI